MDITSLQQAYASGQSTIASAVAEIYTRIAAEGLHPVWISLVPGEQTLRRAAELDALGPTERANLPLFGVPFAVKDNMDVAGLPTTVGCPAFAFAPEEPATVVARLEAAGAILIGKTNMDQFATGLVGTRSPFGACSSVFNPIYISGGSSSGSAVAVASGLVTFALGTDTAGSGRVPAMFNNIIGLKPTRGLLSTKGVFPACRTLDCVSIFAETALDASLVLTAARGFDAEDPYSRIPALGAAAAPWSASTSFRFGVPSPSALNFFGDIHNPALFQSAVDQLISLGGEPVQIDLVPFLAAAQLLYKGPWIAERYAALEPFIQQHADDMNPTVATIISGATKYSSVDAFNAAYKLEDLRTKTKPVWQTIDLMVLPTAPRAYTHAEVAANPIELNSNLGTYTNFVNLLDLSAIAVPAGLRPDGLPFGVSLIAPAFRDAGLLTLADRLHRFSTINLGGSSRRLDQTQPLTVAVPPAGCLLMAVVGAHLSGQPLNRQLTERGGRLVRTCRTHPSYKFYALKGTLPPKPGLVYAPGYQGPGIEVEVWALPEDTVGTFVEGVPPPLCIGTLGLEDGSHVKGFLVEPAGIADATDITHFGGWRSYLQSLKS